MGAPSHEPPGYRLVARGTKLTLLVVLAAPVVAFLWCDYARWRELGNLADEWRHPFLTALAITFPLGFFASADGLLLVAIKNERPWKRTLALLRALLSLAGVLGAGLVALLAFVAGFASAGNGFAIDRRYDSGSSTDVGIKIFFVLATPWIALACLHALAEVLVLAGALRARAARGGG